MLQDFWQLFMTFLVYAVIGWLWETFYCSLKSGHFVYRGFLLGPYCPVYGFGVSGVLLLTPKNYGSTLELYLYSIVIATVIEYIASYLLEKLFNMKLWDYSDVPFNINGRVALPVSIFWGFGCVILIKYIEPFIGGHITNFINSTKGIAPAILFVLFMADVISSLEFSHSTKNEVASQVDKNDPENASAKEWRWDHIIKNHQESDSHKKISAHFKNKTSLRDKHIKRLLKNYPNMKFTKGSKISRVK